jgi:hypothetical protein
LNNLTVLEVLWFVICSQLAADIDDANFWTILEYPACALTSFTEGTKELLVDVNILCVDDDGEMSALLKVATALIAFALGNLHGAYKEQQCTFSWLQMRKPMTAIDIFVCICRRKHSLTN